MIFDEQNKRNALDVFLALAVILAFVGFCLAIYVINTKQWITL